MKAILACTPKGGIGYKNKLPWSRLEGDLVRFKELTRKQYVIMGRSTWDSLPKRPLPERDNVVVTSRPLYQPQTGLEPNKRWERELLFNFIHGNCLAIPSIELFAEHENAWVIGGAKLIAASWPLINELHLSRTYEEYECDTFIDLNYIEQNFNLENKELHSDHSYEIWKRKDIKKC